MPIIPRLEYSSENFIMHSGVLEGFQFCLNALQSGKLFNAFFVGDKRSGKSHLALSLASRAANAVLLEGAEFSALMHHYPAAQIARRGHALFIDDAQHYLSGLKPGSSGPLVNLFEECKRTNTCLIFISALAPTDFKFDEHVATRLAAAMRFSILPPQFEEAELLLQVMAKQRGLFLSERNARIMARKLPRDLASIEEFLQQFNALDGGKERLNLLSILSNGF